MEELCPFLEEEIQTLSELARRERWKCFGDYAVKVFERLRKLLEGYIAENYPEVFEKIIDLDFTAYLLLKNDLPDDEVFELLARLNDIYAGLMWTYNQNRKKLKEWGDFFPLRWFLKRISLWLARYGLCNLPPVTISLDCLKRNN